MIRPSLNLTMLSFTLLLLLTAVVGGAMEPPSMTPPTAMEHQSPQQQQIPPQQQRQQRTIPLRNVHYENAAATSSSSSLLQLGGAKKAARWNPFVMVNWGEVNDDQQEQEQRQQEQEQQAATVKRHDTQHNVWTASFAILGKTEQDERMVPQHSLPRMEARTTSSMNNSSSTTTNDNQTAPRKIMMMQVGFQLPHGQTLKQTSAPRLTVDESSRSDPGHDHGDDAAIRWMLHHHQEGVEIATLEIASHRRVQLSVRNHKRTSHEPYDHATLLLYIYHGELHQINHNEPYWWFPAGSLVEMGGIPDGNDEEEWVLSLETQGTECHVLVLLGQRVDDAQRDAFWMASEQHDDDTTAAMEDSTTEQGQCHPNGNATATREMYPEF